MSRKCLGYVAVDIWVFKYSKRFCGPVKFLDAFGRQVPFRIDSCRLGKIVSCFQTHTGCLHLDNAKLEPKFDFHTQLWCPAPLLPLS